MKNERLLSAALTALLAAGVAQAQSLADLVTNSKCRFPVYFAAETFYAGRIFPDRNRVKVQVVDFGTAAARDDFLKRSHAQQDEIFPKMDTIHEFSTSGEADFGSLPLDVYKGIEKSGERYYFKVRGTGADVKKVKVLYRFIPPHGQVVIHEVNAADYFERLRKDAIEPALRRCRP